VVPVLKIGEVWRQDSRENCLWLDELYPERSFAGTTDQQREAIVAADQWVTDNIVALHFRTIIDKNEGQTTIRNARRMANVILPTSKSIPSWLKRSIIPIWHIILRNTGFVKRAAHMLDTKKDVKTLHSEVLQEFENRIRETGFLAGTDEPSFADIAAFAELAFLTTYGFESNLTTASSSSVSAWYDRVKTYFPSSPIPALFPQWPPTGF
jgi:glutathione S-transferase